MGGDQTSEEIVPQESSPTFAMPSPEVHQSSGTYSTTQDTNGKADISELAPTGNSVITSPFPADQTGASEENKEPNEGHENDNNVTVSNNLSSIEVKVVARPLLEDDDHSDPVISPQVKNGTDSKNHQNPTPQAKEQANMRVAAALSEIEVAKESKLRSLKRLEEAVREKAEKRAALETALEKAERAKEGKLGVEHELRMWRAENQQKRKSGGESVQATIFKSTKISIQNLESRIFFMTPNSSGLHQILSPKSCTSYRETDTSPEVKVAKKKKKSVFPKIFMFLGKKKSSKSLLTS